MNLISKRYQFRRRISSLLFFEALDEYTRAGRGKLLRVGFIDEFLQPLTAREDGPNFDLFAVNLDDSAGIFAESSIPASLFQAVRPDKHAPLDDHRPDADDAMWFCARANTENLRVVNSVDSFLWKSLWAIHG